jgi:hypothetical protein
LLASTCPCYGGCSPRNTNGWHRIGAAVVENPFAKDSFQQFCQVMVSIPWRSATDANWAASVSPILTACLWAERSRQVTSRRRAPPTSRTRVAARTPPVFLPILGRNHLMTVVAGNHRKNNRIDARRLPTLQFLVLCVPGRRNETSLDSFLDILSRNCLQVKCRARPSAGSHSTRWRRNPSRRPWSDGDDTCDHGRGRAI